MHEQIDEDVIYAWFEPSRHGAAKYEIILKRDGDISCDCPGYIYKRKDKERGCIHIRKYANTATEIMSLYRTGRPLPPRQGVGRVVTLAALPPSGITRLISAEEDDDDG